MSVKYGFAGKFYFQVGGTYGSPTWAEGSHSADVKVGAAFESVDSPVRIANGVKTEEPVLLALSLTGKYLLKPDDDAFEAFEGAFLTRTPLDVLILTGDKTVNGNRGWRLDMKVHKWEGDQANGVVQYMDFELKPCIPVNGGIKSAVVASGAPAFTAF